LDVLKTILIAIQFIVCIGLIVVVLMQDVKTSGMGAVMGGSSETFFGKNRGRTKEALLKKLTIASGIIFGIVTLAIYIL